MEHGQERERSAILNGVASALNTGGNAVVYAYDFTSGALGKVYDVVKQGPASSGKLLGVFSRGFHFVRPSEIRRLKEKIKEYEAKIKQLYYEIGKEGASHPGDEIALGTEPIKKLLADVREYEKEIERLGGRIVEIEEQTKAAAMLRKQRKQRSPIFQKTAIPDEKIIKTLESAVAKAAKQGRFDSPSEEEIFGKVVTDMLDSDAEIKILSAGELGKIGNEAAVPVLMAASALGDTDLNSEIMNSLIMIGSSKAVPLFFEKVKDRSHRIRIVCLRGIYKLSSDEEALPVLIEALQDPHAEVRRTAATFIGWKDYPDSGPALAQCLRDQDARVRKAAVSAIANLKDDSTVLPLINVLGDKEIEIREKALEVISVLVGEDVAFDIHASRSELTESIRDLKDWWQKERIGDIDIAALDETDDVEVVAEAEETAEEAETDEMEASAEAEETAEEAEADEMEASAEAEETAEEAEADEMEASAEAEETTEEAETDEMEASAGAEETAEEADTDEMEASAGADETTEEADTDEMEASVEAEAAGTDIPDAAAADSSEYTQDSLMKMLKSELLDIAKGLDIDTNDMMTKAEISELILGK